MTIFEVKSGDKTIKTVSQLEDIANIFHLLRKACSQQRDTMFDDTTKTFLYQNENDNCYLKFDELSHTWVILTKVPY